MLVWCLWDERTGVKAIELAHSMPRAFAVNSKGRMRRIIASI